MKLKNNIALTIIATVLLAVGILLFLINYSFKLSFSAFLEEQQNFQFEQISQELNNIFLSRDGDIYVKDLEWYAYTQQLYIEVEDQSGSIAKIDGLPLNYDKDEYVEKKYDLLNSKGIKVGRIIIGYIDDPYHANESAKNFNKKIASAATIAGIITLGFGLIISEYFSRAITDPLEKITEATSSIRNGDYDQDLPESKIKEVQELSDTITYLKNSLKSQDEIRTSYAQDISHELRTPLTNINLHLEAIKDGVIEADSDTIDMLISEVDRLNSMVDKLKDTFNENVSSIELKETPFDLAVLIDETCHRFRQLADESEISLACQVPDSFDVKMDMEKIEQILNNLISNAIKATDPGGHILVSLKKNQDRALISVKDDGCGISEEDQEKIFRRFYRVDSARNSEKGGRGLGLSIVNQLVSAMGGRISVFSKLGEGTEFLLVLPL